MPLEITDAVAPAGARYRCSRCTLITNSEAVITSHVIDGLRCRFESRSYHDSEISRAVYLDTDSISVL